MPSGIRCGELGYQSSDCAFQMTVEEGLSDTFFPDTGELAGAFEPNFGRTYFRFYVKWSDNFAFDEIENKVAYFGAADPPDGGFAYGIKTRVYSPKIFSNTVYSNYAASLGLWESNTGASIYPQGGKWYCVEMMIEPSSANGGADGKFREWIDGELYMKKGPGPFLLNEV